MQCQAIFVAQTILPAARKALMMQQI